jgi:hypothetical protein
MSDGVCDTTDRYGGNPPCVWTMCKGQCEGMGFVPNEHADGGWKALARCGKFHFPSG